MAGGRPTSGKGKGNKRPPAKRPGGGAKPPATGAGTQGGAAGQGPDDHHAATRVKSTRAERLEAARRARKRKAALTRAGIVGAVLLLVAVAAGVTISNRNDAKADRERLTAGSCSYDTDADSLTSNNHVPPARYRVDPPAGGDHDPSPAPAGIYDDEGQTPPADANLVHSLEHGLVVLWHRPDLTEAETSAVREVFDNHSDDVIVVPRASLDVKVAATSWGRRLLCGEVEPDRLSEFVDLYRDKSPEPGVR